MGRSVAIFVALSLLSCGFIGAATTMSCLLAPERKRLPTLRWLLVWFIKGLALPMALWMVMNIGISWDLQPFMPAVQAAQNRGGPWFRVFLRVVGQGFFIVSSYWAALTLGWVLWSARAGLDREAAANFKSLCWTCFLGMIIPSLGIALLGGWPVLGFAAFVLLTPMAAYAPKIVQAAKSPPIYARAIARLKFGKYAEAEWEILRELEKCEDDFEGWLMLADLYASHFRDVPEAEQTILEICDHPKTSPSQLSVALHRLADWQLKIAGDPDAARRALHMIGARLPGSHLAHMAQLRLRQLPQTASDLKEQSVAAPIPLPALGDSLDQGAPPVPRSDLDRRKAAEAANACVERLKLDPNYVAARERLARLFAERLDKPELGLEQLGLLLEMPGQEAARRAEWLSLTAAWHLRYRHDPEAGRKALERVLREFPNTPQALAARRRLHLLQSQEAQQAARPAGSQAEPMPLE